MPLNPGVRLGAYEIVALVGSGGMGEVYRARDPRLGRDVAIKVVAAIGADSERLRRFEQEARAAAALSHPNILAVHDVGTAVAADATTPLPYVVAELLEGETLRERLQSGPLPLRKSIDIAIQIARGLAAAHDKGIVHRDLKPENVFVTEDGRIKVLDFGLAKLHEREPALSARSTMPTSPPETLPGVVLGTIGYMAPEQVRGLAADHRADIFAFGTILYEMLSGRRAFHAATSADTMTAILKEDPPDLPLDERAVPPGLARVVDRCLEKSPSARFQSAWDLAFALEALSGGTSSTSSRALVQHDVAEAPQSRSRWLAWGLVAALSVGLLTIVGLAIGRERTSLAPNEQTVSFVFNEPEGWRFVSSTMSGTGIAPAPLAIAPDGSRIAFLARNAAGTQTVWVRAIDTLGPQMLPGTEGAASPFWSPDSRFIGFFADGKLKKIDVGGGPPVTIADAPNGVDGSWGDNVIVFAIISGEVTPLQRVPAAGGIPSPATTVLAGETKHVRPLFLPDGRHLLFRNGTASRAPIYLTALDSNVHTRLVDVDSTNVAYSRGYLLFMRDRTLMAQPFADGKWILSGDAFPIAESIAMLPSSTTFFGQFAASLSGVLVYQVGPAAVQPRLQWLDRTGQPIGVTGDPAGYGDLELSPDGQRATVSLSDVARGTRDIWTLDLNRGLRSRFTFDPADEQVSVWSPDGANVVFNSRRSGHSDLYIKPANGASGEQLLLSDTTDKVPTAWSHDGRFVMFVKAAASLDLWVLPMTGDRKAIPFLESKFNESAGRFSPDGRWVAYVSGDSGRPEVYVTSFPQAGGRWQISTGGGAQPRWRADGAELVFRDVATNSLVAAAVRPDRAGFTVTGITPLFPITPAGPRSFFDMSSDGQRFLVNAVAQDAGLAATRPMTVVVNWAAAHKK